MKICRTVSVQQLINEKPHQFLSRLANKAADRYPSAYISPLLLTTTPLTTADEVVPQELDVQKAQKIKLTGRVCFDSKPPNPYLPKEEALKRFCQKAGLIPTGSSELTPLPADRIKGNVTLINVFDVVGFFIVSNEQLFKTAFELGVGRRFSYGYGLLGVSDESK